MTTGSIRLLFCANYWELTTHRYTTSDKTFAGWTDYWIACTTQQVSALFTEAVESSMSDWTGALHLPVVDPMISAWTRTVPRASALIEALVHTSPGISSTLINSTARPSAFLITSFHISWLTHLCQPTLFRPECTGLVICVLAHIRPLSVNLTLIHQIVRQYLMGERV